MKSVITENILLALQFFTVEPVKTLFQLIAEQKNHDNGTCGDALSDVECVIVSIAPAWEKSAGLEGHTYQTNRKKDKTKYI